jgi:hypothetical protein
MIMSPPDSQRVDAGSDVTFSVQAYGLPRPKYQWMWKGNGSTNKAEIIPGANSNSYTIWDVQTQHAGQFSVVVSNGLETQVSPEATLVVEVNPGPPEFVQMPVDMTVFPGQTATFVGRAQGYPAFQYQWQSNGVDIPTAGGQEGRILTLPDVTDSMSGTFYTLIVWNDYGITNATAVLHVVSRPKLHFSEVMGNPNGGDSSTHYSWFELTNYGTNTVDLMGYRFADRLGFFGLGYDRRQRAIVIRGHQQHGRTGNVIQGSAQISHEGESPPMRLYGSCRTFPRRLYAK